MAQANPLLALVKGLREAVNATSFPAFRDQASQVLAQAVVDLQGDPQLKTPELPPEQAQAQPTDLPQPIAQVLTDEPPQAVQPPLSEPTDTERDAAQPSEATPRSTSNTKDEGTVTIGTP